MPKLRKFFRRLLPTNVASDNIRPGTLIFRCNICGNRCSVPVDQLGRETESCTACGSTVRMRSVIRALSLILFGQSLAIPDFPPCPGVRVVGLSDWIGYAIPLARKMNYQNTFYHEEPRLDITSIDPALEGTLDVLISTEVFEHVSPPVSAAFQNSFRLLKPGGALILTVPYSLDTDTLEHFPELHKFEILEQDGKFVLHNTTRDGQKQVFDNLVFHGGPGQTLEMRLFSLSGIKRELETSGFSEVETLSAPDFAHGIYNQYPWSLPIIARKSKGV